MCVIIKETSDLSDAREQMLKVLEQMKEKGVELFLDGRLTQPREAAAIAVCEDSPYMADYVFGDAGNISQIRFDRVINC